MRIYFDVSCLNRPFDDQTQARIHLESETITLILQRIDDAEWEHVSSQMADMETDAISDDERRKRVKLLLPDQAFSVKLDEAIFARAGELEQLGVKPADAVHLAAAESLHADVFLTCDDRLRRTAQREQHQIAVKVANPIEWLREIEDDENA